MRLIDADKLKFVPALIEPVLIGDEPHWETIILKDRIDNAPTVDAVPVVQGKWTRENNYGIWKCSECGCKVNRVNPLKGNIWNYYYCPNCGADMRGEQDG